MMGTPPMVPAGWYADPAGRHEYRYWDGTYWTAGVADGGVTANDPLEGPPAPAQQAAAGFAPAQQQAAETPTAEQPAETPGAPGPTGFSPVQQPAATPPQQGATPPAQQAQTRPEQAAAGFAAAGAAGAAGGAAAGSPPSAAGFTPTPQAGAGFGPAPQAGPRPGQQFAGGFQPGSPLPGDAAQAPPFPAVFGPVPGGPAPATEQHGRRRWGLIAAIAGAVVVLLIIGLVIWAPWTSPPLLRPTGLSAGTLTTDSVAFHWSNPRTGPLPDKYLILHDGKVIGSVSGTVTSYQVKGLAPDTSYQYRIVAERGGKRSAMSSLLAVRTTIPPISAARWQGTWTVNAKFTRGSNTIHGAKRFTDTWLANPRCATGPCDVRLSVTLNGHSFKLTMARNGANYKGTLQRNVFPCGSGSTQFPVRSTLTFRVTMTTAAVSGGAWLASGFAGSVAVTSPYTASGNLYCPTAHQALALTGSP